MYLCGLLNKYVYFSYGWWYGWYQGYYPCKTPNECTVPITGWYDEFTNKLGEPLSDGIWTENRMICHLNGTDYDRWDLNTTNIDGTNGQTSGNGGNDSDGVVVGLIVGFVVLVILAGLIFWAHRKFGLTIDCQDGCKVVCSKDKHPSSNYQQL